MPNKPLKYCKAFPCPNLAVAGSAYCLEHKPARAPKKRDKFYGTGAWRRFRDWYIGEHPFCEQCEQEGRQLVMAVIVDHIIELKDGGLPFSEDNAMSLCRSCHKRKTDVQAKRRKNHQIGSAIDRGATRACTADEKKVKR